MPNMSEKMRADLAARLRGFGKPELDEAALLLDAQARQDLSVREVEALADQIWDLVSKARDRHSFEKADDLRMDALEAEMAGRTLVARIHLGTISHKQS